MRPAEELSRYSGGDGTVLTIGTFDGVHIGHQFLIQCVKDEARRRGLRSGVVTFDRIPRTVIRPDIQVSYLTDLADRLALLRSLGLELVVPLTFNRELSLLTAQEFMDLLVRHLGLRHLVVGPDFALGRGREGTAEVLTRLGEEMGYSLETAEPLVQGGEVVSSTAIRQALDAGDLETATRYLGRPHTLSGLVIPGHNRGKGLGFPTANVDVGAKRAWPRDGVYVTWARLGQERLPSVTNIGDNPTFEDTGRNLEVHILDFSREIYGRELHIDFIHRLRDELRFPSPEALVSQIREDVAAARTMLVPSNA